MRLAPVALAGIAALTAACSGNPAPAATAPQPAPAPVAAAAPRAAAPAAMAAPAAAPAAAAAGPMAAAAPAPAAMPAAAAGAVDLSGDWTATVEVQGQSVRVNINLVRGPNGYTGNAAPEGDQAVDLSALTLRGDSLTMTFTAPNGDATFSGSLTADRRTVNGQVMYQGQSLPFVMVKH